MGALTVLLYDAILMLPQELVLVWNARLSFVRAAYILNRYMICVAVLLMFVGRHFFNAAVIVAHIVVQCSDQRLGRLVHGLGKADAFLHRRYVID